MNIQSNINQGLSLASMLVMMNPTIKQKQETNLKLQRLGREEATLVQQYGVIGPMDIEEAQHIEQELGRVAEEQFRTKPTRESFGKHLAAKYGEYEAIPEETRQRFEEFRNTFKNEQIQRQKANANLAAQQERERFSRSVTEGIYSVANDPRGTPEELARHRAPKPNVGEETF